MNWAYYRQCGIDHAQWLHETRQVPHALEPSGYPVLSLRGYAVALSGHWTARAYREGFDHYRDRVVL